MLLNDAWPAYYLSMDCLWWLLREMAGYYWVESWDTKDILGGWCGEMKPIWTWCIDPCMWQVECFEYKITSDHKQMRHEATWQIKTAEEHLYRQSERLKVWMTGYSFRLNGVKFNQFIYAFLNRKGMLWLKINLPQGLLWVRVLRTASLWFYNPVHVINGELFHFQLPSPSA